MYRGTLSRATRIAGQASRLVPRGLTRMPRERTRAFEGIVVLYWEQHESSSTLQEQAAGVSQTPFSVCDGLFSWTIQQILCSARRLYGSSSSYSSE